MRARTGQSRPAEAGDLARALRAIALRAIDQVGGGIALIFASELEGDRLRLRTAAGFPSPEAARSAADVVLPDATVALTEGGLQRGQDAAALGPRAAGGTIHLPLLMAGHRVGVMVVGGPEPIAEGSLEALSELSESAALRLDHARLCEEAQRGEAESGSNHGGKNKSDEILKLSEALFAQDIELLRNNEKLGKIEKLKNDFIEKMSRELRTPLNSIIEAIICVLAGENEALSEVAKTSLRAALDDGTAFLRTLQNILDLWRIKQNELPVEMQDVNLPEVVDEAIFSIQDTLGEKPITIEKHFEQPFPKLRTDLSKINQIFFLLLDNAAKFTERGQIDIRVKTDGNSLVCEIRDTGIGICPDDQQFVFDEFYQVDELNSTKYRGSGLGLALVRDLLVLLDGGLMLTSEVGEGTTVTFHVPIQIIG